MHLIPYQYSHTDIVAYIAQSWYKDIQFSLKHNLDAPHLPDSLSWQTSSIFGEFQTDLVESNSNPIELLWIQWQPARNFAYFEN